MQYIVSQIALQAGHLCSREKEWHGGDSNPGPRTTREAVLPLYHTTSFFSPTQQHVLESENVNLPKNLGTNLSLLMAKKSRVCD
mmetsp:Transcript_23241/g.37880  ORF Transcript_23241/g.37880 Transcript_23241/m.37880 type:complete len:84 (+) Transcript_23241:284-535(+)